jgi:hypothetical protein
MQGSGVLIANRSPESKPVLASADAARAQMAQVLPEMLQDELDGVAASLGGQVAVAGGAVLRAVTDVRTWNDIDLFLVGFPSSSAASTAAWRMLQLVITRMGRFTYIAVSSHALSVSWAANKKASVQVWNGQDGSIHRRKGSNARNCKKGMKALCAVLPWPPRPSSHSIPPFYCCTCRTWPPLIQTMLHFPCPLGIPSHMNKS